LTLLNTVMNLRVPYSGKLICWWAVPLSASQEGLCSTQLVAHTRQTYRSTEVSWTAYSFQLRGTCLPVNHISSPSVSGLVMWWLCMVPRLEPEFLSLIF
jgi:hypothetical protein